MDFYDDSLGQGERAVAALHASSWPPTAALLQQWRSNNRGLCKLSSIPEVTEQQDEKIRAALREQASEDCEASDAASSSNSDSDVFGAIHGINSSFPELQFGDLQQEPHEAPAKVRSEGDMGQPWMQNEGGPSRDSSTGSPADQGVVAADLTAAAATTWMTNIRHFTDCMPISPDSVCSSSTYCSLMVVKDGTSNNASSHQQDQQSQLPLRADSLQQQQHRSYSLQGTAALPCSLPNSSSSASLVPADEAAAAGQAAVQASLLEALHELDELEFLPFDRVAQWLEAQAAAAAAGGSSSSLAQTSSSDDAGARLPRQQPQQQQQARSIHIARQLSSSGSDQAGSSRTPTGGSGQQQAEDEALFDAPDWWQEAVLARLQQQREAFQGTWWSRARVLASLAAQKAACALQV